MAKMNKLFKNVFFILAIHAVWSIPSLPLSIFTS